MQSLLNALLAIAVLGSQLCAAAPAAVKVPHVLHEKRNSPSSVWAKRDRVESTALLPLKFGLRQGNLHLAEDWLIEVSDPTSPKYGQHWTADQVTIAFAPHADTMNAIHSWLTEAGIHADRIKQSINKGWVSFEATAAEAEALLKAEFYEHEHVSNGKWSVGCDEYHLPASIRPHIDYVTPGIMHTGLRKRKTTPGQKPQPVPIVQHPPPPNWKPNPNDNLTTCDQVITPACISALYQIAEPAKGVHPGNSFGVFEDGDFFAQQDLNHFFANFTPWIPQGTKPTVDSIDGGMAPVVPAKAGAESDLDLQIAYPIVYPQEVVVYQVDDINYSEGIVPSKGFGNTFLEALDGSYCNYTAFNATAKTPLDPKYPDPHKNGYKGQLMCGTYKPTNVISISYGEQEDDLPAPYQERQCNEFLKLGLQGVSIFVASGDTGVAGTSGDGNPNGCLGPDAKVFNPTNPNSCPYVTNVGATRVSPNHTVYQPESGAYEEFGSGAQQSLYTSSGGFSNIYTVPKYQKAAIDNYFKDHNPPYPYYEITGGFNASKVGKGLYNRIGHGIPDVAANGQNIAIVNDLKYTLVGGTSAASPIFASIVSRINDARLNAGKKTVGFINPALYQNPSVLNDITNGTNNGCGTEGFKAVPGWDPVTGLGTPNYGRMLNLFLSLP